RPHTRATRRSARPSARSRQAHPTQSRPVPQTRDIADASPLRVEKPDVSISRCPTGRTQSSYGPSGPSWGSRAGEAVRGPAKSQIRFVKDDERSRTLLKSVQVVGEVEVIPELLCLGIVLGEFREIHAHSSKPSKSVSIADNLEPVSVRPSSQFGFHMSR